MNNMIRIFENEKFGKVRTVIVNGEPWFVGKDTADILGYRNGSRDINRHVDKEDRAKSCFLTEIRTRKLLSSTKADYTALF